MSPRTRNPRRPDADIDRRWELVSELSKTLTGRPGMTLELDGIAITVTEEQADRNNGTLSTMGWQDEPSCDAIADAVGDATVTDEALSDILAFAAVSAIVSSDAHEFFEFFHFRGERIFDPHPTGSRWERWTPVEVTVRHHETPWTHPYGGLHDTGDFAEVPYDEAAEVLALTAADVTFKPFGRWEAERVEFSGSDLVHAGLYPDRETGELKEFTWSRELLDSFTVPVRYDAPGQEDARRRMLTAGAMEDVLIMAMSSIVHEAAEWVHLDGVRVFDPHPGQLHIQHDLLIPNVVVHSSVLI